MILGFAATDLAIFIAISMTICIVVCTLAMEASVLFTPAFVFLFPLIVAGFPKVSINEAIGLAITVEFFGYTSSVLGYWFRRQIDFNLAFNVLLITVPLAVVARVAAYFVPDEWLLVVFAAILFGLAAIIYRAYRAETVRHTCLLCGDSLTAMKMEQPGDSSAAAKSADYVPRTHLWHPAGAPTPTRFRFNMLDRPILAAAGAFAGLVGVAIGEISNTFLTVRKQVPIKISTGTSALVLHVTILAALATNLLVLRANFDLLQSASIVIPWKIAFILAPVVIVGGQIGSFINSRLADGILLKGLMSAYVVVGLFVLYTILTK